MFVLKSPNNLQVHVSLVPRLLLAPILTRSPHYITISLLHNIPNTMAAPRINTRSKNVAVHPGLVLQAPPRRTSAQVKADKAAKKEAKETANLAAQAKINRAAAFENAAMANEDLLDATPRPLFTPKPKSTADVPDSETDGGSIEVDVTDGLDGDQRTFVPMNTSETEGDAIRSEDVEETPVPKRRVSAKGGKRMSAKTVAKTAAKVKQKLEVVEEVSANESEARPSKIEVKKSEEKVKRKKKSAGVRIAIEASKVASAGEAMNDEVEIMGDSDQDQNRKAGAASKAEKKAGEKGKGKAKEVQPKDIGDGPAWHPKPKVKKVSKEEIDNYLVVDKDDLEWLKSGDSGSKQASKKRSKQDSSSDVEVVGETKAPIQKKYVHTCSFHTVTPTMLTLNPTTLFYWNLSADPPSKKVKYTDKIVPWSKAVPIGAKPEAPKAETIRTQPKSSASAVPSLTIGSSRSTHTAKSVLSNQITIKSKKPLPAAQVKQEPDADFFAVNHHGFSDDDEVGGVEREAAIATPFKGKARLNSAVSL